MNHMDDILRRADGSIATDVYMARGRTLKGRAIHRHLTRLASALNLRRRRVDERSAAVHAKAIERAGSGNQAPPVPVSGMDQTQPAN